MYAGHGNFWSLQCRGIARPLAATKLAKLPDVFTLSRFRGGFSAVESSAVFLVNRKESHRDTDAKTGSPEKCTQPAETLRLCAAGTRRNSSDKNSAPQRLCERKLGVRRQFLTVLCLTINTFPCHGASASSTRGRFITSWRGGIAASAFTATMTTGDSSFPPWETRGQGN